MKRDHEIFKDKVVLITGGSNGIGAALAKEFVQRGANVWLLARREYYLEQSHRKLIETSIRPEQRHGYVTCDVTDEAQVDSAIDQVIRETGNPDILINCAGIVHPGDFLQLDLDKFHSMMDINFFGTVHVIKKILPGMIARGTGHIINVASMAAFVGLYGYSAYAPSKSAVLSFTEALRLELKPKGINVTVVMPTDVDTPQLEYELNYRPQELRLFFKLGTIHSVESIAKEIMRGIIRKKFMILAGFDAKILYWVVKILGNGKIPVLDWMIRLSKSKLV